MLLVALALVAELGLPGSAMPTVGQVPDRCIPKERRISRRAPTVDLRKLNELPDAEAQFPVVREMDGCPIPAKVSEERTKRR